MTSIKLDRDTWLRVIHLVKAAALASRNMSDMLDQLEVKYITVEVRENDEPTVQIESLEQRRREGHQ